MHSWMFGHAMADFGSASLGRKLEATRMVAAGGASGAAGGSHRSNARWYASLASAKRSDVCRASASLNSTSAIACRSPRRSSSGSRSR